MARVSTGLVWATKILTDSFHDIKLYYRAPIRLLRREMIDPIAAEIELMEIEMMEPAALDRHS